MHTFGSGRDASRVGLGSRTLIGTTGPVVDYSDPDNSFLVTAEKLWPNGKPRSKQARSHRVRQVVRAESPDQDPERFWPDGRPRSAKARRFWAENEHARLCRLGLRKWDDCVMRCTRSWTSQRHLWFRISRCLRLLRRLRRPPPLSLQSRIFPTHPIQSP